jgi:hypothetical protein
MLSLEAAKKLGDGQAAVDDNRLAGDVATGR